MKGPRQNAFAGSDLDRAFSTNRHKSLRAFRAHLDWPQGSKKA